MTCSDPQFHIPCFLKIYLADAEVLLVTNPEGWSNTNALQEEPVTKTNPPDAKKQERVAFSEKHAARFHWETPFQAVSRAHST